MCQDPLRAGDGDLVMVIQFGGCSCVSLRHSRTQISLCSSSTPELIPAHPVPETYPLRIKNTLFCIFGSLSHSLCQHRGKNWHKSCLHCLVLSAQLPTQGASPGVQLSQCSATPAQYKVMETSTESLAHESSKWKKADEEKKHTKAGETRQHRGIRKKRPEWKFIKWSRSLPDCNGAELQKGSTKRTVLLPGTDDVSVLLWFLIKDDVKIYASLSEPFWEFKLALSPLQPLHRGESSREVFCHMWIMHYGIWASNIRDFLALQDDTNHRKKPVLTKRITNISFSHYLLFVTLKIIADISNTFPLARHQSTRSLKPLCCSEWHISGITTQK